MSYGDPPENQWIAHASRTSGDIRPFGTCLRDVSPCLCPAAWRMYGQSSFARRLKVENFILYALLKYRGPSCLYMSRIEHLVRARHEYVRFLLEPEPSFAKRSVASAATFPTKVATFAAASSISSACDNVRAILVETSMVTTSLLCRTMYWRSITCIRPMSLQWRSHVVLTCDLQMKTWEFRTWKLRSDLFLSGRHSGSILSGWKLYFLYFVLCTLKVQSTKSTMGLTPKHQNEILTFAISFW